MAGYMNVQNPPLNTPTFTPTPTSTSTPRPLIPFPVSSSSSSPTQTQTGLPQAKEARTHAQSHPILSRSIHPSHDTYIYPYTIAIITMNSSALKYVYIVQQASYPSSGEGGDEILAVYARLEDANQKAKTHIDEEYAEPEDCEDGQDENGCFWWSAADVGEGDAVRVYVVRWEVL